MIVSSMWGSHHREMVDPELPWGRRLWNNGRMPFRRYLATMLANRESLADSRIEVQVEEQPQADRSPPCGFFMRGIRRPV
jgi:hypothetical protein